jgi:3',5'-cyclic-AMP phosphodiesterase
VHFSFVQITDHHLLEAETLLTSGYSTAYAFRVVMHHIAEHVGDRIDFVVSTGDLVDAATDASYQNLSQMLNLRTVSPAPGPQLVSSEGLRETSMYFLPGNHDDRSNFFRYLCWQTPAMPLMNRAFQHKGIQFVCLDWGQGAKGVPHPEMLQFLAETLQEKSPSILLMHHHLVPLGERWLDERFLTEETAAFWEIVKAHQVLGIFCGHAHVTYEKSMYGIPIFGLRSTAPQVVVVREEPLLCIQPLHYRLVTLQDGLLTTRIFEVAL